jgi:hypothetical protein
VFAKCFVCNARHGVLLLLLLLLQVVVCSEDLAQLLPPPSDALAHVVLPGTGLGPVVESCPDHSPGLFGRLEDLAYVIYTSGSTGEGFSTCMWVLFAGKGVSAGVWETRGGGGLPLLQAWAG